MTETFQWYPNSDFTSRDTNECNAAFQEVLDRLAALEAWRVSLSVEPQEWTQSAKQPDAGDKRCPKCNLLLVWCLDTNWLRCTRCDHKEWVGPPEPCDSLSYAADSAWHESSDQRKWAAYSELRAVKEAAERDRDQWRAKAQHAAREQLTNQAAADTLERLTHGHFAEVTWANGERELVGLKSVAQLTADDERRRGMDCLLSERTAERDALAAKVEDLQHSKDWLLTEREEVAKLCGYQLDNADEPLTNAVRWKLGAMEREKADLERRLQAGRPEAVTYWRRKCKEAMKKHNDIGKRFADLGRRLADATEHERQTHERLSAILGTGDSLANLATNLRRDAEIGRWMQLNSAWIGSLNTPEQQQVYAVLVPDPGGIDGGIDAQVLAAIAASKSRGAASMEPMQLSESDAATLKAAGVEPQPESPACPKCGSDDVRDGYSGIDIWCCKCNHWWPKEAKR